MRTPGSGTARLIRVGLFAAVPLLLAGGAHLVGGGSLPTVGVLLGAVALLLVSTVMSADRCRFAVLVPVLATEQVLLHLLLAAAEASARCLPTGPGAAGHLGHAAYAAAAGGLQACAENHAMHVGGLMIAAHAAATVAAAWLLARAETWWWGTVAALVRVTSTRPTRPRQRRLVILVPVVVRVARLTLAAASPRGPPLFA